MSLPYRLVLAIFAILSCPISAAGKPSGTINVAIIDAKPFGFRDAAGEAAGIYPDIIRAVSERSGQRVRMTVVPFARAAALVSIGLTDATLMIPNAGITNGARPIGSVLTSTLVVAMRPGLTVSGDRPFDGRLLGRIRGGCQELNQSRPFYELNVSVKPAPSGRRNRPQP